MSLIKHKGIDIPGECPHCGMRAVGGRVYVHDTFNFIVARWLYECGQDIEQWDDGTKINQHSCPKVVDRTKTLS